MIELKDYKYKELCELMNESQRGGKSRILQINNWKRYFKFERPTTQIFKVIEVYATPKEKPEHRGGSRAGSGAKVKLKKEIDILIHNFIRQEVNKNTYYIPDYLPKYRSDLFNVDNIYFNNNILSLSFGLYRNMYEAIQTNKNGKLKDPKVQYETFKKIADKIREKCRSWILNRMSVMDGIRLTDGIIAYKTNQYDKADYRDDLLPEYNELKQKYMKKNKFTYDKQIIDSGKWNEMDAFITFELKNRLSKRGDIYEGHNRYRHIKKCHKLIVEPKYYTDFSESFSHQTVQTAKYTVNHQLIDELYTFFLRKEKQTFDTEVSNALAWDVIVHEYEPEIFDETEKMKDYKYILDNYIDLNGTNAIAK